MKSTFLKKLLCWTLALLCVLPLAAACTEQPDTQPDEPIDEPPEEQPDEQPTPQQPTDDEPPKEDFPMFDYVAFTDVDFSDLTNFKEAEGADSGASVKERKKRNQFIDSRASSTYSVGVLRLSKPCRLAVNLVIS